ncbi:MAG TPA: C-terminal helicase domain-containing protein, partial [Ktedonobacteraceae bacterium]|nr:C-terminal helicase domain-containing protein [Ktedonobacteraceae bacterium]
YTQKHADALSACVPLRVQYRMNEGICEFASKMFYSGNLVAHPSVAHRVLSGTRGRDRQLQEAPAITRALLPSLPTVFLRVRNDGNMRPKTSDAEARAVRDVVAGLLARGVAEEDIGIIAPYRAQVANLRRYLFNSDEQSNRQNNGQSSWQGLALTSPLTVDTVDRFQGGERKVMIISFATTSAPEANSQLHNFLTNPNRLNVALTRAQRKLILVGYAPALKTLPVFKHLLLYCKYNDALIPYQVPPPLPPKGDHIQSTSASISREVEADLLRNE